VFAHGADSAEKRLTASIGIGKAIHHVAYIHSVVALRLVSRATDVERDLGVDEVNAVIRNDDLPIY